MVDQHSRHDRKVEAGIGGPVEEHGSRRDLHRKLAGFRTEDRECRPSLEPEDGPDRVLGPVVISEPQDRRKHPCQVAAPNGGVPRVAGDETGQPFLRTGVERVEPAPSESVRLLELGGLGEPQDRRR